MDFLSVIGIGLAIGMLAGTTGTQGAARGRMTLLAAVIGLVVGFLLAGWADVNVLLSALLGLLGAAAGCIVVSDIVHAAGRREGSRAGALAFFVSIGALLVVIVSILLPILVLLFIALLGWIGGARRRRSQRKYEGLRVLR